MKKGNKFVHWCPRIMGILAVLFVSMFALDSFDSQLTVWEQISAFLVHLIPSFILLVFLLIAWRWELVGGILLAAIGTGMAPLVFMHNYVVNQFPIHQCIYIVMLINFPFVLAGGLFILDSFCKKISKT
ncbi:MAG: hypothetical protein PHV20_12825 [Bacteroidales bacterium]|nr:hypothetical protein [Bacteroidales bacterium]